MNVNLQLNTDISVEKPKQKQVSRSEQKPESSFKTELDKQVKAAGKETKAADEAKDTEQPMEAVANTEEKPEIKENAEELAALISEMVPMPLVQQPVIENIQQDAAVVLATEPAVQISAIEATAQAAVQPELILGDTAAKLQTQNPVAASQQVQPNAAVVTTEVNTPVAQAMQTDTGADSSTQQQSTFAEVVKQAAADSTQAKKPADEKNAAGGLEQVVDFKAKLQNLSETVKTAVAQPAAKGEAAPVYHQVTTGLLKAFEGGKMEFTMKLQPEELGELTVKMMFEGGKLSLNILTDNAQASKLIAGQMAELKDALKGQDIHMDNCSVENQSFNNLLSSNNSFMAGSERQQTPQSMSRIIFSQRLFDDAQQDMSGMQAASRMFASSSMLNCYA